MFFFCCLRCCVVGKSSHIPLKSTHFPPLPPCLTRLLLLLLYTSRTYPAPLEHEVNNTNRIDNLSFLGIFTNLLLTKTFSISMKSTSGLIWLCVALLLALSTPVRAGFCVVSTYKTECGEMRCQDNDALVSLSYCGYAKFRATCEVRECCPNFWGKLCDIRTLTLFPCSCLIFAF